MKFGREGTTKARRHQGRHKGGPWDTLGPAFRPVPDGDGSTPAKNLSPTNAAACRDEVPPRCSGRTAAAARCDFMIDETPTASPRTRFRLFPESISDDDYIERVAKNLRHLDRWWWVAFGLWFSGLTAVCWMASLAVELVRGMLDLAQKANLIPNANLNALRKGWFLLEPRWDSRSDGTALIRHGTVPSHRWPSQGAAVGPTARTIAPGVRSERRRGWFLSTDYGGRRITMPDTDSSDSSGRT